MVRKQNRKSAFRLLSIVLLVGMSFQILAAGVTVTIGPTAVTLALGADRNFSATANGAADSSVTWSVNGVPGGNSSVGLIASTSPNAAHYVGPTQLPSGGKVVVTATSVADRTASASGVVTFSTATSMPNISSLTPNSIPVGAFTIKINGSNFKSTSQVLWNGAALQTQFNSSNLLTATGSAPAAGNFTITVSNGTNQISNAVVLKVVQVISVSVTPASVSLLTNASQQFHATVSGGATQAVTWMVNGTPGGDSGLGLIDISGNYTAPQVRPAAGMVTIGALAAADGVTTASAAVFIQDPMAITYGRFLDQTTFGPTPQLTAHLGVVGMSNFLDEQFGTAESTWPTPLGSTRAQAVDAFFGNIVNGQDQLRQRVIYALSEIFVVAMNKNTNGDEIIPWLQILSRNAFGNYRTLLRDITIDGSMGHYLDLANSGTNGGTANENYPREVMQLFSLGVSKLNNDGSTQLDINNQPIPTYTQTDVQQMAKALTGWTYNSAAGTTGAGGNGSYYPGPMLQVPGAHNKSAKTILGVNVAANQTAVQDLDSAVDILFNHPNLGPFVATRLIRALVTSNPSPQYISDIASVFNGNGSGAPRGDMKGVIRAILMHPEARNDNPGSNFGRLRTPVQFIAGVSRALNLHIGAASNFNYLMYNMNEGILDPNSVFGHYSPLYRIPNSGGLFGPEFQIYSASDAVVRAQFFYGMIYQPWPINPNLLPFVNIAGNSATLINAVDSALLYGRMSSQTRASILAALPPMYDNNARVITAVYFAAMSGDYLVQR